MKTEEHDIFEIWCEVKVSCAPLCSVFEKSWSLVPTLNRIFIFANWSSFLVGIYILKMSLIWQQRSMLYFNFGVRFNSLMHHFVHFSLKKWCGVPSLNGIIIFASRSSSLVGIYILKLSRIWHQWSVLYFSFGVLFKSIMHHCDCVCWYACYPDTNL